MKNSLRYKLGAAGIGLSMMFGVAAITPVSAQDTPDVPVVEEEDSGFDDWGLLGLIGLAGLLGLKKREDHQTHVVDRTGDVRH